MTADTPMTRVAAQAERLPGLYAWVDLGAMPERYTEQPEVKSQLEARWPDQARRRAHLLGQTDIVSRIRAYTMLGDPVVDAYAALMPQYGFRRLTDILGRACDAGLPAVPEAPAELEAFINSMTRVPACPRGWTAGSSKKARASRLGMAYLAPLLIRGACFGTFVNKYAALPMALTGALTHATAARRVLETATFFTVTTLPRALEPQGAGFKSAAMVRLMHSMVRFHALSRPQSWDRAVYGVPIPQVDQMPAGLMSSYLIARRALRKGRSSFTASERAQVELARYRCFLLGLSEERLPVTPQELLDVMDTRAATLRDAFDCVFRAIPDTVPL